MSIKIRASYDSFRELRENGFYYVDKTEAVAEYLEKRPEKAVLFTRPRRFGKTMTMTTFRDFLDMRQDSRDIFTGLKIMEHPEVVEKYMNQYPVIFVSLKEVFASSAERFEKVFCNAMSNLCKDHMDLLDCAKVNEADKKLFQLILFREADFEDALETLDLLTRMLRACFKKPTYILIDEYDVPIAKSLGMPHYDFVREMVERMLSYVCKTNENVKAVLLSGCLYTVKNSAYTGVNNIVPYTVLDPTFASLIGFTDKDVRQLLCDAGLEERYREVETWYDGYRFGRERIYCPWDVMRYVSSLLDGSYSEAMGPESYWLNTSETSQNLIHGFLGKTNEVNERFEQLLAGKCISCRVNEQVPYHKIYENSDNLWSALLETGYLSVASKERMASMPLRLPNRSVEAAFRQEVWEYFQDKVDSTSINDFMSALWAGEAKRAESAICPILEATLSFYHEYREYSYHLILDGFFTGKGYRVISELESGYGRSDLIILDPARNRALLLELKHTTKERDMATALAEAKSQILQNKYESFLLYHSYTTHLSYGMAFSGKKALIAKT